MTGEQWLNTKITEHQKFNIVAKSADETVTFNGYKSLMTAVNRYTLEHTYYRPGTLDYLTIVYKEGKAVTLIATKDKELIHYNNHKIEVHAQ